MTLCLLADCAQRRLSLWPYKCSTYWSHKSQAVNGFAACAQLFYWVRAAGSLRLHLSPCGDFWIESSCDKKKRKKEKDMHLHSVWCATNRIARSVPHRYEAGHVGPHTSGPSMEIISFVPCNHIVSCMLFHLFVCMSWVYYLNVVYNGCLSAADAARYVLLDFILCRVSMKHASFLWI